MIKLVQNISKQLSEAGTCFLNFSGGAFLFCTSHSSQNWNLAKNKQRLPLEKRDLVGFRNEQTCDTVSPTFYPHHPYNSLSAKSG